MVRPRHNASPNPMTMPQDSVTKGIMTKNPTAAAQITVMVTMRRPPKALSEIAPHPMRPTALDAWATAMAVDTVCCPMRAASARNRVRKAKKLVCPMLMTPPPMAKAFTRPSLTTAAMFLRAPPPLVETGTKVRQATPFKMMIPATPSISTCQS